MLNKLAEGDREVNAANKGVIEGAEMRLAQANCKTIKF